MLWWFQGVISCRIKLKKNFLFSFLGRVPVIFYWISEALCNSSFIEEIFNFNNWKKCSTWVFLQFYEPPDLGKKIFTTWNVLKVWSIIVFNSQVDQNMWNLVSKCSFFRFWLPEKSVFELKTNLKFSFPERGPFPQNQYFYLNFRTSKGTLKMLQTTFCPQIQQEKSLKWP